MNPNLDTKPTGRTALIIGASGLVGSAVLQLLLQSPEYDEVHAFSRSATGVQHSKFQEHIVNFDAVHEWEHLLTGHALFSCLGTTVKQAGGKEQQWKVDYTYQYKAAMAASFNGVQHILLVSSLGANPESFFFYTRMKGALEQAVNRLSFPLITILQPASLTGDRKNPRPGERLAVKILHTVNRFGFFKKYRPIPAETVAQAMYKLSLRSGEPTQMVVAGTSIFLAAEAPKPTQEALVVANVEPGI